jgi:hypothetical protein
MISKVWVVAAGDEDKDLVPHMIESGKMFVGPGSTTGDLASKSASEIKSISGLKNRVASSLISFKFKAKKKEMVVVRLGSVCFAVGSISSEYTHDLTYSNMLSYGNKSRLLSPSEDYWNLSHTRDVSWYVLKDPKAIHFFRKGIYGSPLRFYKLGSSGKNVSKVAKKELDVYLKSIGYDNTNANSVLSTIGDRTTSVNCYGFPN